MALAARLIGSYKPQRSEQRVGAQLARWIIWKSCLLWQMWLPAYVPHTGLDGLGTELQAYSCNCLLSYMLEYSRMIWMPTKTPEQMMCIYLLLVRDYFDRLWHQITPWCIYIYITVSHACRSACSSNRIGIWLGRSVLLVSSTSQQHSW